MQYCHAQLADVALPPSAIRLLFPNAPDTNHWVVEHLPPPVNGSGEDFNPYPAAFDKRLYFNSSRPGCVGGYVPDTWFGYGSDIFSVSLAGIDSLDDFRPLSSQNTALHEKEFYFLPDGSKLFLARSKHGIGTYEYCDILVAQNKAIFPYYDWGPATAIGGGGASDNCDAWPSLTANGKTLYFVSDRPGGYGGYDLYISRLDSGKWQPAQNLGKGLNTAYAEYDVQIAPDESWLLFNSNGFAGRIGKQDIFFCTRTDSGWSKPQMLPAPINSIFNDYDVYLDRERLQFYFCSNRLGGYGEGDIFRLAYKPPTLSQQVEKPVNQSLVIYFDHNSATLPDTAKARLAAFIQQLPAGSKLLLTGHTDSDGNDDYNLKLSQLRVNSVVAFCLTRGFVAQALIQQFVGESAPSADNSTAHGKALNRRVTIRIISSE